MLEQVADKVSEYALQIAEQEISAFKTQNPTEDLDEELRTKIKERAISQITFNINKFKYNDQSEDSLEKQFEAWFKGSQEEALRKTCRDGLRREVEKRVKEDNPNMSFLERYLMEHKRGYKKK